MDGSLPGSSVHGICQARALEWGAIAFSVVIMTNWYYNRVVKLESGIQTGVKQPLIWSQTCLHHWKLEPSLNCTRSKTLPAIIRTTWASCSLLLPRSPLVTMQSFQTPNNLSILTAHQIQLQFLINNSCNWPWPCSFLPLYASPIL